MSTHFTDPPTHLANYPGPAFLLYYLLHLTFRGRSTSAFNGRAWRRFRYFYAIKRWLKYSRSNTSSQ